jgi:AAA domain
MHVALGWEYRGLRVKAGPVVYCALEGERGFGRRLAAFRRKHSNLNAAPFYLMFVSLNLIRDHKALTDSIRAQMPKGETPAVVAIDTLNRSLFESESSDENMSAYVRAADAVRDAFDCVVPVIHHCGHNGDRPRGLRSAKPSSPQRKRREAPREDRKPPIQLEAVRCAKGRSRCRPSVRATRPFGQRDLDVRRSTRSTRGVDGVMSTPVFGGNAQRAAIRWRTSERVKTTRCYRSRLAPLRKECPRERSFRRTGRLALAFGRVCRPREGPDERDQKARGNPGRGYCWL